MTRTQRAVERMAAQRIDGGPTVDRGQRPEVVEWLIDAPGLPSERQHVPPPRTRRRGQLVAVASVAVAVIVGLVFVAGVVSPTAPSGGPSPAGPLSADPGSHASAAPSVCREVGFGSPGSSPGTLPQQRLTRTFVTVAVVRCSQGTRTNADGSADALGVEKRTTDPVAVARLVAALELPDARPSTGGCLTSGLYLFPLTFLVDANGHWIRPRVPRAPCGPPAELISALAGLPEITVTTWVTGQTRTAESGRTGCDMQATDLVHVEQVFGKPARQPLTADPLPAGATVRVCRYTVPSTERGSQKAQGAFDHGAVLGTVDRQRMGQLLTGLPPATACATQATRFAVVQQTTVHGPTVAVELDACRHLRAETRAGVVLAQAPAALLALLTGS